LLLAGIPAASVTENARTGGTNSAESTLILVLLVLAADRLVPTLPVAPDETVEGGGVSPWVWRTAAAVLAGFVALAWVALYLTVAQTAIDSRVQQVIEGRQLFYGPLELATFAEPRADRVRVRWIGARKPPLFRKYDELPMTYFGESGGVSVFLDTRVPRRLEVYRLPTALVALRSTFAR